MRVDARAREGYFYSIENQSITEKKKFFKKKYRVQRSKTDRKKNYIY